MKKFFVMISLLFAFLFGCATISQEEIKFHQNVKESVYLDLFNTWSNQQKQLLGPKTSMATITLRLINKRMKDVSVTVKCCYFPSAGPMFGKTTVIVKARDDKIFTIRGFTRTTSSKATIRCEITKIE